MGVIRNRDTRLQLHRARRFRAQPTYAEKHLWALLRDRRLEGWRWRRQVPVGPYIVDFLSLEGMLVVELDGDVHVGREAYDARRDAYLRRRGFRVLRIRNDDFLGDRSAALEAIAAACATPEHPLPRSGKGQGEDRLGQRRMPTQGPTARAVLTRALDLSSDVIRSHEPVLTPTPLPRSGRGS